MKKNSKKVVLPSALLRTCFVSFVVKMMYPLVNEDLRWATSWTNQV
jgi:hypothetical protein